MLKARHNVTDIRDAHNPDGVSAVVRYPVEYWEKFNQVHSNVARDEVQGDLTSHVVQETKDYVFLRQTPEQFSTIQKYANTAVVSYKEGVESSTDSNQIAQRVIDTARDACKHLPSYYRTTEATL